MIFAGLNIEITRDCNLYCPHCMRYEPGESMDKYRGSVIKKEYIDALFEKHLYFDEIVLTGGEPMLHPEMISYIVDKIIEKEIAVFRLQIITNGTIMSEEAVAALNRLYDYINTTCYKKPYPDAVYLGISEGFHDNKDTMNTALEFYTERLHGSVSLFNSETPGEDKKGLLLHYSGRAKQFTASNTDILPEATKYKIALDADLKILCRLVLTIRGNFVLDSADSFQDADKPDNIICSVTDELLRGIVQWNYNNPLNCEEAERKLYWEFFLKHDTYFNKSITEEQKEVFPQCINDIVEHQYCRYKAHLRYPYLYPDDIERLLNELSVTEKLTEKEKYMNLEHWNNRRKKEDVDFKKYCTCPKAVSKEASPVVMSEGLRQQLGIKYERGVGVGR